jgi:hypothetical protein
MLSLLPIVFQVTESHREAVKSILFHISTHFYLIRLLNHFRDE